MKKHALRNVVGATLPLSALLIGFPASGADLRLLSEQTWGGIETEEATGIAAAPDGSVYMTGTTLSFGAGDRDVFLLKFNAAGTLIWQRTYGTGPTEPFFRADEFASDVTVAPDGSVYISGSHADGSAMLVKFAPDGTLVWQRAWSSQSAFGTGVAVAPDGSVYLAGGVNGIGAGHSDSMLVKFTPDGDMVWDRTWGGPINERGSAVAVAPDGSVYLAGDGNSFFANDANLLKFSPDGTLLWERDWRNGTIQELSFALGVAVGADGSVYLTGGADNPPQSPDAFLLKLDQDGALIWQSMWGTDFGDIAADVALAPDGHIYITGNTNLFNDTSQAFVVKFAPTGQAQAAVNWGGAQNEFGTGIAIGADGTLNVAVTASAPRYRLRRDNKKTITPTSFFGAPQGTVTAPNQPVTIPEGIVLIPNGSRTFAGATDAALLRLLP